MDLIRGKIGGNVLKVWGAQNYTYLLHTVAWKIWGRQIQFMGRTYLVHFFPIFYFKISRFYVPVEWLATSSFFYIVAYSGARFIVKGLQTAASKSTRLGCFKDSYAIKWCNKTSYILLYLSCSLKTCRF
jgi:hypothetical protein